jgi:hypothetical protein
VRSRGDRAPELPPVPENIRPYSITERVNLLAIASNTMRARVRLRGANAPVPTYDEPARWAMVVGNYEITVRHLEEEIERMRMANASLMALIDSGGSR